MAETPDVVHAQFAELLNKYGKLDLQKQINGPVLVKGDLHFSASYEKECIEDKFAIELIICAEYPSKPPVAKETGGRIPQSFHHFSNGALCLGAPLQTKMKFQENPTLLGFVEDQIIPYLYSFSYFEKHGKMPFGELAHGGKGVAQYYQQLLGLQSEVAVLGFLRILVDDEYRGHLSCPCSSGKKLRCCHGEQLQRIAAYQRPNEFADEYFQIAKFFYESGVQIPLQFFSKALLKKASKSTQSKPGYEKK